MTEKTKYLSEFSEDFEVINQALVWRTLKIQNFLDKNHDPKKYAKKVLKYLKTKKKRAAV